MPKVSKNRRQNESQDFPKPLQNEPLGASGGGLEEDVAFWTLFSTFWGRLGAPFWTPMGSKTVLKNKLKKHMFLRPSRNSFSTASGLHFGRFWASFLVPSGMQANMWKTCWDSSENPSQRVWRGSKIILFSPKKGNPSGNAFETDFLQILTPFWDPVGTLLGLFFETFFACDFYIEKKH